jgi:hypothetical protein
MFPSLSIESSVDGIGKVLVVCRLLGREDTPAASVPNFVVGANHAIEQPAVRKLECEWLTKQRVEVAGHIPRLAAQWLWDIAVPQSGSAERTRLKLQTIPDRTYLANTPTQNADAFNLFAR